MKKVNSITLLLLITGGLSFSQVLAQPKDIEGWNKTRWNMAEDEVKKTFSTKQVSSRSKPAGGYTILTLPEGTRVDGFEFDVYFLFKENKLKQVHLTAKKPSAGTGTQIEMILTEKYAQPTFKKDYESAISSGSAEDTGLSVRSWNFPSTIIELHNLHQKSRPDLDLIKILYRESTEEGDKNL